MQMPELDADFEISTNNLEAEYEITQSEHFDCSFEIYASGTTWGSITGNIEEQADLQDIFSDLRSNIDDVADDLSIETDNRQTADADLQDNIDTVDGKIDTHIADKSNPHEVTKAQIGLGNVDNTSDLNKPISTATQTALNGKQNTINDLSEIRTNASNGQSAYNTIQNYGDIVTYDASYFATSIQGQKADTALQPNDNISELNNDAGYITSASLPTVNNSTITFQKNNVTVGDINLNQANNETINFNIPTTASDVNALPDTTTINDLTTTAQQNAIDSGANTSNIGQIATNTSNISSLSTTVTNNYNTLDGRITSEVSALNTTIGTETTNRQNADNNLQSQIDAIVSSSDVFDIVGTYAELQAYDISTVPVNDIIKVLVDSTHSNAATYYRCVETGGVKSWSYIGSEGAYYTKSESDSLFVEQTTTVNNKPLSTNITLTASDVGALPSSTTIGNGVLTIQNNGANIDTFSANATSNKTINIVTPTKTSDLTNDSGFIDSSALSGLATQTDLTNGLATKQDTISDLSTIRSNAANGQSAYTTIGGYGDIVTYNASNFVQKNGDSSTQTISLTSGTGTTALGIKSMATSSYISLSGSSGWLGSYGVSSSKRAVFYNGTGYTLAYTSEIPTNTSDLINDSGFITGIGSNDVITALGYTPASNSAFTGADGINAGSSGLVPAPSATDNDKYLKGDGTWASVSGGSSTDVQINGTSITSNNVANILTESAYSTSNKIATMSDLLSSGANTDLSNLTATGEAHFQEPLISGTNIKTINNTSVLGSGNIDTSEIFIATVYTTTFNEVLTAYNAGKTVYAKSNSSLYTEYYFLYRKSSDTFYFGSAGQQATGPVIYTHSLKQNSGWSEQTYELVRNTDSSIASSRFDGQWVLFSDLISLSTATSATTTDVTSTIKSNMGTAGTDSYKYELLIQSYCNYKSATAGLNVITSNQSTIISTVSSGSTIGRFFGRITVAADKLLKFQRTAAMDTCSIYFCGYRRIGTNS